MFDYNLLIHIAIFAFLLNFALFADVAICLLAFGALAAGICTSQLVCSPAGLPASIAYIVVLGSIACSWSVLRQFPHESFRLSVLRLPFAVAAGGCVLLALSHYALFTLPSRTAWKALSAGILASALAQTGFAWALVKLYTNPWKAALGIDSSDRSSSFPNAFNANDAQHRKLVVARYRHLPPWIRFWAAEKLRRDPLFRTLHKHIEPNARLLDVGCGYGLVSVWLAYLFPNIRLIAFDSIDQRVRTARYALGSRALVVRASALNFDETFDRLACVASGERFSVAVCADVIHHLKNPGKMLQLIKNYLQPEGKLLLRTTLRSAAEVRAHKIERVMVWARGQKTVGFYTLEQVRNLLSDAGFEIVHIERFESKSETLFVAKHKPLGATRRRQQDAGIEKRNVIL